MTSKKFYQSKTLIGALVSLLGFLFASFGFPAIIQESEIEKAIVSLIELIGIGLIVWGRLKATKKLSF